MNIELKLKKDITDAFRQCFDHTLEEETINLQPTRKEFEGHFTLVTFQYARLSKKNPQETADILGAYLKSASRLVDDYNVVKGFLNLTISQATWKDFFKQTYTRSDFGHLPPQNQHIVIEYSSPNTNKPLHLGHLRNNFLGFSMGEIYKAAGYEVTRVNLVNDRGIHICKSMLAYQKFGEGETPQSGGMKGDHLIGKYYVTFDKEYKKEVQVLIEEGQKKDDAEKNAPLLKEAQQMLQQWEQHDPDVMALWKQMNGWVYEGFEATYARMGVEFDKTYYESDTYLLGKRIVEEGLSKKLFYQKEDGSVWADLSNDGLDEKLLLRSDGTSVYMTQDLGTADLKYEDFQCDQSVYVVGNEQDYHFDVLFKILKKLGRPYADGLHHLSYGMVDLPGGKMKSREGTVVDADDLMEEMADTARRHTEELGKIEGFDDSQARELYEILAIGALKFFLLKVDPKKRMLFNPEESIQFHGNTGPFVQYTYARIAAILRKARQENIEYQAIDFDRLSSLHETVQSSLYLIDRFEPLIQEAAQNNSPSVLAQFAYDIAKEYNRFYTEETIFGEEDPDMKKFKIAFSGLVSRSIRHAMELLGIRVPERM